MLFQAAEDASPDETNDVEVLSVKKRRKRKAPTRSHHTSAAEAMENILQTHHSGASICHDSSFSEAESPVRPGQKNTEPNANTGGNSDACLCELPAEGKDDDVSVKSEPSSEVDQFDPKDMGSGPAGDIEPKSDSEDGSVAPGRSHDDGSDTEGG